MTNEFVNDEKGWNSNKQSDAQKNIWLDICQKSYRRHCSGGHEPDDRITSMLSRGKFFIVGTEEFTSTPDCSKNLTSEKLDEFKFLNEFSTCPKRVRPAFFAAMQCMATADQSCSPGAVYVLAGA
jgi:hypothetical protein